jgi:putative cell wall-binding protein
VRVSQEIQRVLAINGQVFVLGGAAALSPAIVGDVLTLNVNPVRIAGTDRFDTALKVAERLFPNTVLVGAASAEDFPDGLSGGAMMGKAKGPLLLVNAAGDLVPVVESYLNANASTITTVFAFGGANAVSDFIIPQK